MGVIIVDHGSRRQASNLLLVGGSFTRILACVFKRCRLFAYIRHFRSSLSQTHPHHVPPTPGQHRHHHFTCENIFSAGGVCKDVS